MSRFYLLQSIMNYNNTNFELKQLVYRFSLDKISSTIIDVQKTDLNYANYYTIVTQIVSCISNITVVILSTTILYYYVILLSSSYIMMILFNV